MQLHVRLLNFYLVKLVFQPGKDLFKSMYRNTRITFITKLCKYVLQYKEKNTNNF